MLPTEFTYPRFEANQVLQSKHLNDLFEYLDEQNRLTRTNLIGVGIVCGLDVVPVGSTQVRIIRGTGTTSAGYLITYRETGGLLADKTFARFQDFAFPPDGTPYPAFYSDPTTQTYFPLWQLVEGTPTGSQALTAGFLNGNGNPSQAKVVLLYVDLDEEKLKNCSPNSCDDKGNEVQVTFRALLIRRQDADTLLARAATLTGGASVYVPHLEALLSDMRLRRFDVPASVLSSTTRVIEAYRNILTKDFIENTLKKNWTDAFSLLSGALTGISNGFATWNPPYGADGKVVLPELAQYPYFYDLLSDLIQAYDELKHEAGELLALCCPSEALFPRHLLLGLATENTAQATSQYRHYFLPSPALNQAKSKVASVRSLVQKAMRMLERFSVPALSALEKGNEIRITPSHLGRGRLSSKAIPYYYDVLGGNPSLLSLWDPERSRLGKANQNLSYHAPLYPSPTPDFVQNPLHYELEPYNFLRIEGHIGMPVRQALTTLTQLRTTHRLPFDVVALRTGTMSSPQDLKDLRVEDICCCFDDLEVMFKLALLELRCLYAGTVRKLLPSAGLPSSMLVTEWDVARARVSASQLNDTLRNQSLEIENLWQALGNKAPHDVTVDETNLSTLDFDLQQIGLLALRQAYQLPESLAAMAEFDKVFEDSTRRLIKTTDTILKKISLVKADESSLYAGRQRALETLSRRCRALIFNFLLKEYRERLEKVLQALLLSNYAQAHPGLQHKAGVPVGGTFILVSHGPVGEKKIQTDFTQKFEQMMSAKSALFFSDTEPRAFPDFENELRSLLKGLDESRETLALPTYETAVPAGTVFADFYLPYLCCSGCAPVVVFSPDKPREDKPLEIQLGDPVCSEDKKTFDVLLTISGGTSPYTVDGSGVAAPNHTYLLTIRSGEGTTVVVKDAGGSSQTVTIPAHHCAVEEDCEFPCEGDQKGVALRCRYLLWMERPGPKDLLDQIRISRADLNLPDYGVFFNFINEFDTILASRVPLDTQAFDVALEELIKQLNAQIEQKIGPERFVLGYEAGPGLLTIQYFVCQTFDFIIESEFVLRSRDLQQNIWTKYIPESTVIRDMQAEKSTILPSFGCERANLCKQEEFQASCKEEVAIKRINDGRQVENRQFQFSFTPKTAFDQCFWVFGLQTSPRYSSEKEPVVEISSNAATIPVRLVAITKDGCFAILEQTVKLIRG